MSQAKYGRMILVPSFRVFLQVFSAQMTTPTFRNFSQIDTGWLFAARHTVVSAVQASGNARTRHHSAYYRTFANAAWGVDQIGWNLAGTISDDYHSRVGIPVEIVNDDTNAAKSSEPAGITTLSPIHQATDAPHTPTIGSNWPCWPNRCETRKKA
jgi:hypothetical protein